MALWIGRNAYVVATGYGLARIEGDRQQIHRYPRGALRRDEDPPEVELFAVLDVEATRALVRRRGEACMLWSAEGLEELEAPDLVDAVPIGPNRVLAVTPEGDGLVLRRATVADDDPIVELGDPVPLEGATPLARERRGRVRLYANRCGITVTATDGGVVALLDPKSLEPRFVARVPSQEEAFDLFALATPKGVLVTAVENGRQTVFTLLGPDGAELARRDAIGKDAAWGSSSAGVLWSDDRAVVNQCITGGEIFFLTLPKLEAKKFAKDEGDAFVIDAASDPTGKRHVFALTGLGAPRPQSWRLMRYDVKKTKADAAELPMPDFKPPPPPPPPPGLKRAEGPPTLAVVADSATPWRAAPGQVASLGLRVLNKGGPLRGVYVEVGGNAVDEHLLTAADASVEESGAAEFARRGSVLRAELPGVALDAGITETKGVPPDAEPAFRLIVRVRGERAGSSLMMIRVGPLGATGTSGSALQGRSFVVASDR